MTFKNYSNYFCGASHWVFFFFGWVFFFSKDKKLGLRRNSQFQLSRASAAVIKSHCYGQEFDRLVAKFTQKFQEAVVEVVKFP